MPAVVDTVSSIVRSRIMANVKSKDMQPEMQVRRMLHALGYRCRLHYKDLPGRPDIVFPSRKKAIFVNGCFWHRHSGCSRAKIPALAGADLSGTWFVGADISRTWFCVTALRYPDKTIVPAVHLPCCRNSCSKILACPCQEGQHPNLGSVVLDAESGTLLVWDPSSGM